MKKIQLYLLLCAVAFATGCPNQPSKNFKNKNSFVNNVNEYLGDTQYRCDCFARQHTLKDKVTGECYNDIYPNGPNEAQILRNQAVDKALAVVDDNYTDFINRLDTRRSTTDFVADVIELGTGAATGIAKGERPNQILGIGLTAFRGGRRSSDLNFYKQQTTPILITKMDDNRSKVQATILQKRDRDINKYSMQEAIRDIVAYYNAGTLIRAFTELSKDTAAQAKSNDEKVLRLKGLKSLNAIPSEAEVKASEPIFNQLRDLDKQLDDASTKDKATNRLQAIYRLILNDPNFKATLDKLRKNDDLKATFTKIDKKQDLDGREAYEFVFAVYDITEGDVDLTTRLGAIFDKTKPE